MSTYPSGSIRGLGPSTSHLKANRDASGERPRAKGSDCPEARCRKQADTAPIRPRRRTVCLLNLLRYAEAEAAEQELQITAVLLSAAIADVAQELGEE